MDMGGYAYISPAVNLQVTGQAGFTLNKGVAVFKKTSNDIWIMEGFIDATQNSNATGTVTIGGIVFPAVGSQACSITASIGSVTSLTASAAAGGSSITITFNAAYTVIKVSFNCFLASKPTAYLPDGV